MEHLLPATSRKHSIPLRVFSEKHFRTALAKEKAPLQAWVKSHGFTAKTGTWLAIPGTKGEIKEILVGVEEKLNAWSLAHLPAALPFGIYHLESPPEDTELAFLMTVGWGLGCYSFQRFRTEASAPIPPRFSSFIVPKGVDAAEAAQMVETTYWIRDLINMPANALGPSELAAEAVAMAKAFGAKTEVIVGADLRKKNYPAVYEVGQACDDAPRLIDIRWGKSTHPKITLVGKGVCFDSGGLDIKSSSTMLLMKKDMGGAALVLGLARLIMAAKLPVCLRVLVPAVENSISGNAFRPLDVINTRKGLTVEVGNTDAEGRLILCDALHEADSEKPALLIDCATLTGAARVALGTDLPAYFTPSESLAHTLEECSRHQHDPLWRLPLYMPYDDQLKSTVADISSVSTSAYAGAITAALFLKRFVEHTHHWVHLDMMAWNLSARAGRPVGGEAMGLRALYALVKKYL